MTNDPGMIIGARAIAASLGMTQRQIYHLIDRGLLPTTKIGSRPASTHKLLAEWICSQEAQARANCGVSQTGAAL